MTFLAPAVQEIFNIPCDVQGSLCTSAHLDSKQEMPIARKRGLLEGPALLVSRLAFHHSQLSRMILQRALMAANRA